MNFFSGQQDKIIKSNITLHYILVIFRLLLLPVAVFSYKKPFKKYLLNFWTILDPSLPQCVIWCYFPMPLRHKYVLISKFFDIEHHFF